MLIIRRRIGESIIVGYALGLKVIDFKKNSISIEFTNIIQCIPTIWKTLLPIKLAIYSKLDLSFGYSEYITYLGIKNEKQCLIQFDCSDRTKIWRREIFNGIKSGIRDCNGKIFGEKTYASSI